jgi:integrase
MQKFPKPFYRTAREAWFVQVDGKQINLGPDRDEAMRRYHEAMRAKRPTPRPVASHDVLAVLDAFLAWCEANRAGRTYDWYRNYLESFAATLPPGLTADALKPLHVQAWLDANPTWKTGKRGAVIAVLRALNWAAKMGIIPANPIKGVEKPEAGRRDHVVSQEEFRTILGLVHGAEFRDLLITCWETGCRPQEALAVEARHVDLEKGCWIFPVAESKGKKHKRIVYLTDAALTITRRLVVERPRGSCSATPTGCPGRLRR